MADIYEKTILVPEFLDEATSLGAAIAGAASPWPCQPALDAASGGASDPGPLRGKLSPGPRLEDLAGLRLECAEAGAAGAGAGDPDCGRCRH